MVGGLIMAHGDDAGLRVPPRLAPTQVVVLPVRDDEKVVAAATQVVDALKAAGVRVALDARLGRRFGRRATDWELKGVPVRVEVGPRDLAVGNVTLARRDTGEKITAPLAEAAARVPVLLDDVQDAIYQQALALRDSRTADVTSLADAIEAAADRLRPAALAPGRRRGRGPPRRRVPDRALHPERRRHPAHRHGRHRRPGLPGGQGLLTRTATGGPRGTTRSAEMASRGSAQRRFRYQTADHRRPGGGVRHGDRQFGIESAASCPIYTFYPYQASDLDG